MIKALAFGGAEISGFLANLGFTLARVSAGLMLAFGHGLAKLPPHERFVAGVAALGFPAPGAFAWAAALAEFGGGLCLAMGLATRPAALVIVFTMMTAAFGQHAADPFDVKERALLYFIIGVIYLTVGGGRHSVDALIRRR